MPMEERVGRRTPSGGLAWRVAVPLARRVGVLMALTMYSLWRVRYLMEPSVDGLHRSYAYPERLEF